MAGLSPRFRVCAVDRAGEGRSSPGPLPRDGAAVARDLKAALDASALPAPYILVGHSLGALNMRHFQLLFPSKSGALVLVDPTIPGGVPPQANRARACLAALASPEASDQALLSRCRGSHPEGSKARWESRLSELESLGGSTATGLLGQQPGSLSLPLIVLTAGRTYPDAAAGQAWHAAHARLAALSAKGEARLVADSGHMMMLDQPDAVSRAVSDAARIAGTR
jgi:pimeloyl-ACP methyl ester carboxylesterase